MNSLGQKIVGAFDKDDLLGLVLWFNAGFSLFVRLIHSAFLIKIPFWVRMVITSAMYLVGLIGLAFCTYVNIAFAFVCIVFVGSSSFLGERYTILVYLHVSYFTV